MSNQDRIEQLFGVLAAMAAFSEIMNDDEPDDHEKKVIGDIVRLTKDIRNFVHIHTVADQKPIVTVDHQKQKVRGADEGTKLFDREFIVVGIDQQFKYRCQGRLCTKDHNADLIIVDRNDALTAYHIPSEFTKIVEK